MNNKKRKALNISEYEFEALKSAKPFHGVTHGGTIIWLIERSKRLDEIEKGVPK